MIIVEILSQRELFGLRIVIKVLRHSYEIWIILIAAIIYSLALNDILA